jgi:hypothetical protein
MERLVYKHIYNYLIDNNLITSHQSGFTPGDSAVNQLLYITHEFGRALDEGKEVRVAFCDTAYMSEIGGYLIRSRNCLPFQNI